MALYKTAAISYNKSRLYSQKAIDIIQFFVGCRTTGVFDAQTVEAIYRFQESPRYGFAPGSADGMVGPSSLGVMIMELDYLMRKMEANVLRNYAYKIQGVMHNPGKNLPVPQLPKEEERPEPENLGVKEKDIPRQAHLYEVRRLPPDDRFSRLGGGESWVVGNFYLGLNEIRRVIGGGDPDIYFIVVETRSEALRPFFVGKVFKQTQRGFISENKNEWLVDVGNRTKGGQAMMKKEVELLMGGVCAGVGAFGGFAALTASSMQFLLMNSKELFTAARGIRELMKVGQMLSEHTPEFYKMSVTVLKLSIAKTPKALWSDEYGSVRLAGELAMIVGEAVLLKRVKSLGLVSALAIKMMQGLFGKLSDASTIALAGEDLVDYMKQYDPSFDSFRARLMLTEIKEKWHIVGPAITAFKAAVDQMVGA